MEGVRDFGWTIAALLGSCLAYTLGYVQGYLHGKHAARTLGEAMDCDERRRRGEM